MEELKVKYEELELADTPSGFLAKYNNQLFSGIAIEETELDLKSDVDIEYSDEGKIVKKVSQNEEEYYLESEDLCFAKRLKQNRSNDKYDFEFKQDLLLSNIEKLASKYHWFPIRWFIDKLLKDDNYFSLQFLHKLIEHKDEYFKSEAAYFLGELGHKSSIPYLQKISNNSNKPWIENRFDFGGHGNSISTGQRAKDAIQKIKKKNSFWTKFYKVIKKG